jgi:hypothetical protein
LENKAEFNGMVIFLKIAQASCVLSTRFCGLAYLCFELVLVGVIVATAVRERVAAAAAAAAATTTTTTTLLCFVELNYFFKHDYFRIF